MVKKVSITTLVFQDYAQDCVLSKSYNSLGLFLSPEYLLNFFWNLYVPVVRKSFKFMVFRLLEIVLTCQKSESRHLLMPPSRQISLPGSYYSLPPGRRKLIRPPANFLENI